MRRVVILLFFAAVIAACAADEGRENQAAPGATDGPAVALVERTPTTSTPTEVSEPTADPASTTTITTSASEPEPTTTVPSRDCWVIDEFDDDRGGWGVILDGVMGGLSSGTVTVDEGSLVVTGTTNTNGGGFVMARRRIDSSVLGDATGLRITARPDGRNYEIIIDDAVPGRRRLVSHFASVEFADVANGDRAIGTVEFSDLEPRQSGRPIDDLPFDPELITTLGIILFDGFDGDFLLEVDRLEGCA